MGAWGSGILQNDGAQDSLVDVADEIEKVIEGLSSEADTDAAGALQGAIGLLMQFSPYSLASDGPFHETLVNALQTHRSAMNETRAVSDILDALVAGETPDYDVIKFPDELEQALHGPDATTFPMQKTWARAPDGFFRHAQAKALVQKIADGCVEKVRQEFDAGGYDLGDYVREGCNGGALAFLLIVSPIHVDPALFQTWARQYREAQTEQDESEADFFATYNACMEQGLAYGAARFGSD